MTKQSSSAPISTKESVPNFVDGVLQNYLDQLLVTATQQPQKVEKVIAIPEEAEPVFNPDTVPLLAPVVTSDMAPDRVPDVAREVVNDQSIIVERVTSVEIEAAPLSLKSLTDQDSWSSQGVECLVFSVCGLKLAVPLLFLGGVHEVIASDVKPLMGQPSWYLGMVHTAEQNLQVIDTANFIMPERHQHLSEQGFKYLIQLEKSPWAIACQSIDDTVRLEASEIKWRGERGKRTWLAGTVIEKMCALIDVAGLLQSVERNCKTV
ncbi:MAG: chemotaxis protein CheW [Oleispira sp.]